MWHRFAAVAEERPDDVAVASPGEEMSYGQLMSAARGIAGSIQAAGVPGGDRVGILAPKSPRSVSAMLGSLMAGTTHVPVDPNSPAPRAQYILNDAGVRLLFTERRTLDRVGISTEELDDLMGPRVVYLDDDGEDAPGNALSWQEATNPAGTLGPRSGSESNPAFILYTSGSTGRPKGVVITHRNALTFVDWGCETFDVKAEDRLSSHAPFHFDLSVFDLFAALSTGASVHVVPPSLKPFPFELARWIEETEITTWYSVPSALVRLLMQGGLDRFSYERLRTVLFAGEVFPVKHLRPLMEALPHTAFHNLYGPTETNVCTFHSVPRPLPPEVEDLPIGIPCANTEIMILDEEDRPVAAGEPGELVVRGPAVMAGYWGLPERTAEALIQNPLQDDFVDMAYRTGDLVEELPDGTLRFLGRRDHMVKIRGYRVELGEVEHGLLSHDEVEEAAVVALDDELMGSKLVAAVSLADGSELSEAMLSQHCLDVLPRYSVPEAISVLPALPRTSTGKTDRMTLRNILSDPKQNGPQT